MNACVVVPMGHRLPRHAPHGERMKDWRILCNTSVDLTSNVFSFRVPILFIVLYVTLLWCVFDRVLVLIRSDVERSTKRVRHLCWSEILDRIVYDQLLEPNTQQNMNLCCF